MGLAARALVAVGGAAHHATAGQEELVTVPDKAVETVLEQHTLRLMSLPGVVGVGQCRCAGTPCIKVLVLEITPDLVARIDDMIEGYKVEVVATGEIRALDSD